MSFASIIDFKHINLLALPPALAGTLIFLLGLSAFYHERRLRISGSFFLLASAASLWLLTYSVLFVNFQPQPKVVTALFELAHVGISFIPALMLLFISAIVQTSLRFRKGTFLSLILSFLFCVINLKTNWWIQGARHYFWGFYPQYGAFSYSFILFSCGSFFSGLYMLWRGYQNELSDRARARLKAFFIAFSMSGLAGVDFLSNYGIPFYPIGYLPIFVFIILSADTMQRYRLSNVTLVFAAEKILETMHGMILVIDLDGMIRVVNRAAAEALGYEKSDLVGLPAKYIMCLSENPEAEGEVPFIQKLLQTPQTTIRGHPMRWMKKSGQFINLSVSMSVIRGRDGDKGDGVIYAAQDLAELQQSQEFLRESEDRLKSVTESAYDAIISADQTGCILSWNWGACKMFGYTEEEALTQPFTVLMPEKNREFYRRGFEQMQGAGENHLLGKVEEIIGLKKDGTEFPAEAIFSSWQSKRGTFYSLIIRDATKRKQLQAERDRYFNLSLDMLCLADSNGYFKQVNPAWENVLGWTTQELTSRPFMEFIHPEDHQATLNEVEKLKVGKSTVTFENRCRCKDGQYKSFMWSAIVPPGEKLIYAAARDITESKKNRQMRLRLAAIVESSNDAILIVSEDGKIRSWNRGAEKIYGYTATDVVERPVSILFSSSNTQDVTTMVEAGLQGRGMENYETIGVKKNGEQIRLSLTVSRIQDEVENKNAISLICRNITKVKEAEQILRHRKDLEMKSNFISMVSHELRTPLTVISMGVDILRNGEAGELQPQQVEWVDMCYRNVSRLTRLISKVLDFQKLESGRMDYDLKSEDLNLLVQEIKMSIELLLRDKNVAFKMELAPDLPAVQIDRDKITEVLMNVLGNAAKFTFEGSITVKTETLNGRVRMSIRDTGIGIKPEDIHKLFSSFTQIHGAAHRTGGTGLGLSISKKIIEQHGGQIWAESKEGAGTTFFIEFLAPAHPPKSFPRPD